MKSIFKILLAFILVAVVRFVACNSDSTGPIDKYEWKISTPETVGLDSTIINDLINTIHNGTYGEIHSLLILRHGQLAVEEYFHGYTRDQLHPVYSVTKSVTSASIGIALDQGKIDGVDSKLLTFFPEYKTIANMDTNKQAITLSDVLTMRAGFAWDELSIPYTDTRNPIHQLLASPDWIKFMLDLRMSDKPGTRFRYNSGCTVLFSGILRNKVRMQAEQFARMNLLDRLGITTYTWESSADGLTNTGWGLSLQPRDMMKFGYMYLQKGKWEGKQIVSENWVSTSTTPYTIFPDSMGYGYQWWLMPLRDVAGHTPTPKDITIAWGWGDQFIFVIPALDMVVVSTAGNYSGQGDYAIVFLRDYIIRAVKK